MSTPPKRSVPKPSPYPHRKGTKRTCVLTRHPKLSRENVRWWTSLHHSDQSFKITPMKLIEEGKLSCRIEALDRRESRNVPRKSLHITEETAVRYLMRHV